MRNLATHDLVILTMVLALVGLKAAGRDGIVDTLLLALGSWYIGHTQGRQSPPGPR